MLADPRFVICVHFWLFTEGLKNMLGTSLVERPIVVGISFFSGFLVLRNNYRGDWWSARISCSPISSRTSKSEIVICYIFDIELQQLYIMRIRDCLKPFFGCKKMHQEGVWHSLFFSRLWLMPCASTKHSHSWVCVETKLVMMTSRPGGDWTQETWGVSFRVNVEAVCWQIEYWFNLLVRYPSIRSRLKFGTCCFATSHPLDALLSISSRPWPMPCASTKPSHTLASMRTRSATRELRSVGWSDAERLGEVVSKVDGSGLRSVEYQWKRLEVTGFDQRVYCWALNLFRM